jgi:hypothetical protein
MHVQHCERNVRGSPRDGGADGARTKEAGTQGLTLSLGFVCFSLSSSLRRLYKFQLTSAQATITRLISHTSFRRPRCLRCMRAAVSCCFSRALAIAPNARAQDLLRLRTDHESSNGSTTVRKRHVSSVQCTQPFLEDSKKISRVGLKSGRSSHNQKIRTDRREFSSAACATQNP